MPDSNQRQRGPGQSEGKSCAATCALPDGHTVRLLNAADPQARSPARRTRIVHPVQRFALDEALQGLVPGKATPRSGTVSTPRFCSRSSWFDHAQPESPSPTVRPRGAPGLPSKTDGTDCCDTYSAEVTGLP